MDENNYMKVSPFTGGKVELVDGESTVTFRGEKITAPRQFYRCVDTGREFTDDKVDDDFIWAVFREYCNRKYPTLTKIIEHEIPDLIEKKLNDEQEIYEFLHENYYYNHDYDGFQSQENHPCMDREDMLEFARYLKHRKESAKNADNKPHDTPTDIEDAHPIDIPTEIDMPEELKTWEAQQRFQQESICLFSDAKPDKNGMVYRHEAVMDAVNKWKERLKKTGCGCKIGELSHPEYLNQIHSNKNE